MRWGIVLLMLPVFCFAEEEDYVPSIENGKVLYQSNCSVCHGVRGDAQTAMSRVLVKKPRNFSDDKLQETLSPSYAFDAITEGRKESGMQPFGHLTIKERWDMAAYIFTLQEDFEQTDDPRPELMWWQSKDMTNLQIKELFFRRGVVDESEVMKQLSLIRRFPQ